MTLVTPAGTVQELEPGVENVYAPACGAAFEAAFLTVLLLAAWNKNLLG